MLSVVSYVLSLNATVYITQHSGARVELNKFDRTNGAAVATYDATLETKGWDYLSVELGSSSSIDDKTKAFAAGFLEGYLTANRIWTHHQNMHRFTWNGGDMPEYVANFFKEQQKWVSTQVDSNPNDPYWQNVGFINQQFLGLVEGYNSVASNKLSYTELHTMASFGDLFDITNIKHSARPNFNNMTTDQINTYVNENTHCSAIIKVAPDLSDIYFGHTSWFTFTSMTRIYKKYKFDFQNPLVKAKTIAFSSYPAVLASNDDFYVTSQKMVVIETTNVIIDTKLWDLVKPSSLLCWQRAMLANRISSTAPEWVQNFGKYNSGTYNNQFMALDLKLFIPGEPIQNNTLWIAEQIPGLVQSEDVSGILQYGYWPSYNVPYSANINQLSGIYDLLKRHPDAKHTLSYQQCSRATIFRRDQTKVDSMAGIKRILRYNDYTKDPLSLNNPGYAIASRFDLSGSGSCGGGYDSKASSYSSLLKGEISIINGPTYDQVPVFENKGQCGAREPFIGLPKVWKFDWITVNAN